MLLNRSLGRVGGAVAGVVVNRFPAAAFVAVLAFHFVASSSGKGLHFGASHRKRIVIKGGGRAFDQAAVVSVLLVQIEAAEIDAAIIRLLRRGAFGSQG